MRRLSRRASIGCSVSFLNREPIPRVFEFECALIIWSSLPHAFTRAAETLSPALHPQATLFRQRGRIIFSGKSMRGCLGAATMKRKLSVICGGRRRQHAGEGDNLSLMRARRALVKSALAAHRNSILGGVPHRTVTQRFEHWRPRRSPPCAQRGVFEAE